MSNLETVEPQWFGRERIKEPLDQFFRDELSVNSEAACVCTAPAPGNRQSMTQTHAKQDLGAVSRLGLCLRFNRLTQEK